MRILFDQGVPVPLRNSLTQHQVSTAYELGWSCFSNGQLLSIAEQEGFDVLVTTDKNLKYQQNLASQRITIIVLSSTSWPRIKQNIPAVIQTIDESAQNNYVEVFIP